MLALQFLADAAAAAAASVTRTLSAPPPPRSRSWSRAWSRPQGSALGPAPASGPVLGPALSRVQRAVRSPSPSPLSLPLTHSSRRTLQDPALAVFSIKSVPAEHRKRVACLARDASHLRAALAHACARSQDPRYPEARRRNALRTQRTLTTLLQQNTAILEFAASRAAAAVLRAGMAKQS